MIEKCPQCNSLELKKNGFVFGVQRYQCKTCGHQFTKTTPHGKESTQKALALSLCHLGVSQNQTAKILSITPTSVARWIKEFPKNIPFHFTQRVKTKEFEETNLKSYIRQLYIENKENFLVVQNAFASGYEVDVIIKDRKVDHKKNKKKLAICGFGDSILEGVIHDAQTKRYHILQDNFVALSGQKLNVDWRNFARHGSTVIEGEKQLSNHLNQAKESDYILLSFGANESNYDWDGISKNPDKKHTPKLGIKEFHQKYVALIHRIQKMGKMPLLLSMVPVGSDNFYQTICQGRNAQNILKFLRGDVGNIYRWNSMYNFEVFKIAQETNVPVVDITTNFLKELDYTQFLCDDGVHPNEKGHALIAQTLSDFYKEYFK